MSPTTLFTPRTELCGGVSGTGTDRRCGVVYPGWCSPGPWPGVLLLVLDTLVPAPGPGYPGPCSWSWSWSQNQGLVSESGLGLRIRAWNLRNP